MGVLVLPRWIIEPAGSGAVLAMLLGSVVAVLLAVFWGWVSNRYPAGGPLAKTRTKGIGSIARFLIIFMFIGFFSIVSAMVAREFGEVVVTAVLTKTPLEVIVLILLGLAGYLLRQPVQAMVRVYEVLLPLIIFPVLFIALFALKNARPIYLLPLLGNNPAGLWEGSILALASFEGMIVAALVVIIPSRPQRLVPPMVSAVLLGAVVHLFVVGVTLSVFGPQETRALQWPTLELARITSIPGNILERLEAIFLAVWVAAVFTTLAGTLTLVVAALARLLGFPQHNVVVPWLLPILYFVAMIPPNIQALYTFLIFWVKVGLVVLFAIPCLMWVVYLASPDRRRRKRARPSAGTPSPSGPPSGENPS